MTQHVISLLDSAPLGRAEPTITETHWTAIYSNCRRVTPAASFPVNRRSSWQGRGFLSKVGGLDKDELGLVELKNNYAIAAVKRKKITDLINKTKHQKIKGKKAVVRPL